MRLGPGSSGDTSSADEFLDAALAWFGDSHPRLGTAWEKGERLAKLPAQTDITFSLTGVCCLKDDVLYCAAEKVATY